MKTTVSTSLEKALETLKNTGEFSCEQFPEIHIESTKDKKFGDYASNIALLLAKPMRAKPREIAEKIVENFPPSSVIEKVEIAGPGFINFYLTAEAHVQVVKDILQKPTEFGKLNIGQGRRVLLEFVSANPTGPLHVGHGRSAAFGATLGDLLTEVGFDVHREYYVNDAGRQMNILAASIYLRYLELCGLTVIFPQNGYKGEYVKEIADTLFSSHKNKFQLSVEAVFDKVPEDVSEDGTTGDKEDHIDGLIKNLKTLLEINYALFFNAGLTTVLEDIKDDLAEFGVDYHKWFSEQSLLDGNARESMLLELKAREMVYEQDGATWFKSTEFGDDKDRVLLRANGEATYFANDLAYHLDKYSRGYDEVIDIFGADHHGYVARVKAGLKALGHEKEFTVIMVQFATLYRDGKQLQMSTRSGEFVTIRQLRGEVGRDAARFFYVMRKNEQHMDFDLDLATSRSNENPVFYVQYAHARICSVFRQLEEQKLTFQQEDGLSHLASLTSEEEVALIDSLGQFTERLTIAATHYEPHLLVTYCRELAACFHSYYNAVPFLKAESQERNSRLCLVKATQVILQRCLRLLSVSAPETM
jgi:arginyl-tRNA synthetase